jgi:hypothetical protein
VTSPPPLPRRDDDKPPDWWTPYTAEFPRWRAWRGVRQYWARLPGTMLVCHADDPADLADQVRAAYADTLRPLRARDYHHRP